MRAVLDVQEHEKEAASGRLAVLGLVYQDLEYVLRGADAEARMWTEAAPPTMAGLARWGKTSELLRRRLLPRGWLQDDWKGLPRTVSPERDFAIVATSGDAGTGLPGTSPANRNPKGTETLKAIGRNLQLAFEFGGRFGSDPDRMRHPEQTWLLLYYAAPEALRAELSLPRDITPAGYVTSWQERILLPAIGLPEFDIADAWGTAGAAGTPDVTVSVEKRQMALPR
jgi:hypothetical protein